MKKLESLYEKANFNVEAKCSMMQKAVNEFPDLVGITLYRSATTFDELKNVVEDLEKGGEYF